MSFQIYSSVLSINSHIVRVNALQRVVIITVHAVIVPLWFIFFAITKQLPVVALPSITRIAISFSLLNPSFTAIGKNITQKRISFKGNSESSFRFAFCLTDFERYTEGNQ